jgi:bla regulator protein blaR1
MNLVAHLWESTLCVGFAALLTVILRRGPARTRHAIWLAASLKFLVPFSLLVAAGRTIGSWAPALVPADMSAAAGWLDQSLSVWRFDAAGETATSRLGVSGLWILALAWLSGTSRLAIWQYQRRRAASRLVRDAIPLETGREVGCLRATVGASRLLRFELRQSPLNIEPCVAGIMRPTILWPAGLSDRLSDAELDAVLAHEVCHIRRRDNLSSLAHSIVETVFWFHPLVWWLGNRLVTERERACDEEVVQMAIEKERYAEGILKVCRFCVQNPAAFVAGIGTSRLAERIERIMCGPSRHPVSTSARAVLAMTALLSTLTPVAIGVLDAQRSSSGAKTSGSAQAPQTVYRKGDEGVTFPKLVHETKPKYTSAAMQNRIQGSLKLAAVVREDGTVGDVTVVESLDKEHGLDDQAVKTAKTWRFEPGTKDGKPVAVRVEIEMSFKLK